MTPVQSIRKYCLDCCGDSPKEVRLCPNTECFLYPFRMGKNPNFLKAENKKVKKHDKLEEQEKSLRYLGGFGITNENRGVKT